MKVLIKLETVELILVTIVLVYIGTIVLHVLWKTTKIEPQMKKYYYGIAFFLAAFMIGRIFFIMNDIVFLETGDIRDKQGFYYIVGSFFTSIATFGILFVVEKYVYKKLHFIPSIIILISSCMILILPKINGFNMVMVFSTICSLLGLLIPLLYLIVGFQTSGKVRKKSFILALGIIVFIIGNVFNMGLLKDVFPILIILSPITIIIGIGIFHYGFIIY